MIDTKHTPGPWRVFEHSWCDTSIGAPGTSNAICRLDINHATEESQEADEAQMAANARLIAAAPELLEALQRLSAQCERLRMAWQLESDAEKTARAVIAKATGGAE